MRMNESSEFSKNPYDGIGKVVNDDGKYREYLSRATKIFIDTPEGERQALLGDVRTMARFLTAIKRIAESNSLVDAELYWLRTMGIFGTRKVGAVAFGSLSLALADYNDIQGLPTRLDDLANKVPTYLILMRILGWVTVVDREKMFMKFNEEFICDAERKLFLEGVGLVERRHASDPSYFTANLSLEYPKNLPDFALKAGQNMFNSCFPPVSPFTSPSTAPTP
jgi:hypothetical protein